MSPQRRSPRFAVLPPMPAVDVNSHLGELWRKKARELTKMGKLREAQQFTIAADEVEDAARDWFQRTSPSGSAEVPESSGQAESGLPPELTEWWTSARVAEELDMTDRGARYLASKPNSPLRSTLVGGRRLFDPVSVLEEKRRRLGDDE